MSSEAGISDRRLFFSLQFGFVVIGVATVLLGQVLPVISGRLVLTDAEAGTLFLAQFSGSITGTLVSGRLIRRYGFVATLISGIVATMAGLPGLLAPDFMWTWAGVFVLGAGLGLSIPATNLLTIAIASPLRRTSALNAVNFCWGIGAICSQPFAAFFIRSNAFSWAVAVLCVALAILVAMVALFGAGHSAIQTSVHPIASPVPIWSRPLAWAIAGFNFVNIGIESALGGWLTTYSTRLLAEGKILINVTVIFFAFLVAGRGIATVVSRRVSENRILLACTFILAAGVLLIVASWHPAVPLVGAALAGAGTSAIFPTNLSRFNRTFGPSATHNATPLFIAGTAGAAAISLLVGDVSTRYESLDVGIRIILFASVLLICMQVVLGSRKNAASEHSGE